MDKRTRLLDKYTGAYTNLENKLKDAGLDVLLLRKFIIARTNVDVYDAQCRIDSTLRKKCKGKQVMGINV
jgi:hypothetical protein